ncbi:MAG: response regulator transcription factor [Pseudomonadota bacterium]
MQIAIVEDNTALAQAIAHTLRDQGHGVVVLHDGNDAITYFTQEHSDLLVLDVNLPSQDGFAVLKSLRTAGNKMPVIMLTARSDLQDRLKGLDTGADDYLVKPFEMDELSARIRALLRRQPQLANVHFEIGPLEFDRTGRRITHDGTDLTLTQREFAVLECLFDRANRLVSKTQLVDHLYGVGADVEEKVIEVYVSRLRKKLAPFDVPIKAVRGLGYMLSVAR